MFKDLRGYVKKGFRQAKNAVGGIIHSDDSSAFDERVTQWEGQIEGLKKLKDSLEVFVEALSTVGAAGVVLGEALNQHFVNQTKDGKDTNPTLSQFIGISTLFDKINADMNNNIQTAFRATITNRCMKPLNAVLSKTPEMLKKLELRKTLIIDRDVYKVKVEKDAAAKNVNMTELSRHKSKLLACSEELEKIQNEISDALDQFDEAMPDLFGNEIAAMVASMYYYSSSSAVLLGQLLPFLPQSQSTLCLLSMSTASTKFLQSPAARQELEAQASAAVVQPTYERTEIYGGGIGEYGVKMPVVTEEAPLQTEPYPAPKVPHHHISNLSHLGSNQTMSSVEVGEEFISPLHANLKNLPGYKNTGKTLAGESAPDFINSSSAAPSATASAAVGSSSTSASVSASASAVSSTHVPVSTLPLQSVHVESAVTTARDERHFAGGPSQTVTSQEQLDHALSAHLSRNPSVDGHSGAGVGMASSISPARNLGHGTGQHPHPIINFPPPPSSSHALSSARSVASIVTADSIPAAQPQPPAPAPAPAPTPSGIAASRLSGDFGVQPMSPVIIKPAKPLKTSVKSTASTSQSPVDVTFDDSDI